MARSKPGLDGTPVDAAGEIRDVRLEGVARLRVEVVPGVAPLEPFDGLKVPPNHEVVGRHFADYGA